MPFNERLQTARKTFGATQKEVAEYLGISERSYRHWENGTREPSIASLVKIADLYGVSLDWLTCRDHGVSSDGPRTDPLRRPRP